MGFAEAVQTVLAKYADFNGRARRSEYWWWALAVFLVFFVLEILSFAVHIFFVLLIIVALGLIVPNLAVAVRRMHDIGKSGWFVLMGLIPFVGWLIVLIFAVQDSQPDNQYGPSPKYPGGGYGGYGGQPGYGAPGGYQPPPQFGAPPVAAPPGYGTPPPAAPPPPPPGYGTPPPPPPGYGTPPPPPPGYGTPPQT